MAASNTVEQKLETLCGNFKLASKVGYTSGIAGAMEGAAGGGGSMTRYQGATFLGIVATKPMESPSDFGDREFASIEVCILWPLGDGVATAPYQYKRGSKLDPKTLQAMNKTGLPLTMWADTSNSIMRFHTWTKSGFNRGPRDSLSWEFSGDGTTLTIFVEPKDLEETLQDNGKPMPISFYMDGKKPAVPIMDMDLVRICLMPKSKEALNKPKKTCFAFKGIGPCTRTPASYLPRLKALLPKTLAEASAQAEKTIREGKVQWAHQLSMTAPSGDGDFSSCEARTVTFMECNIGGQTTFMYESLSPLPTVSEESGKKPPVGMVRMCIKSANGFSTYHVDMPVHNVLRYTNANTLEDAVGFMTLAASAGALCAIVMHNTYWGTQTTSVSALAGQTPFHGVPIIDVAKLMAPILSDSFLAKVQSESYVVDEKSDRKAKVKGIDMGFKVYINTLNPDGSETQEDEMVATKVWADISLNTRCIQSTIQKSAPLSAASSKSHDLRLAPHGSVDMDNAHVLCLYCCMPEGKDAKDSKDSSSKDKGSEGVRVIMNLDFNASPEVGFLGGANALAGKKHAWHSAIPSAIDESSDEEDAKDGGVKKDNSHPGKVDMVEEEEHEDGGDRKKMKKASLEVASEADQKGESEDEDED